MRVNSAVLIFGLDDLFDDLSSLQFTEEKRSAYKCMHSIHGFKNVLQTNVLFYPLKSSLILLFSAVTNEGKKRLFSLSCLFVCV